MLCHILAAKISSKSKTMKIEKNVTQNFNDFAVVQRTATWWQRMLKMYSETELVGVLEADDSNGRVVTQVHENGYPVFTNESGEEIVFTNTVKVLMLDQLTRMNFYKANF